MKPKTTLPPTFFETPADFRRWLRKHHKKEEELWVGFRKKGSGLPSITWPESVDEALCFGWIDGVRKSVDADSYKIRFSPRRKGSIWSNVNTKRATELIREGRMQKAGLAAFEARDAARTGVYSFERATAALSSEQEAEFRSNAEAWAFFQTQPPGYRKLMAFWIVSAKQKATQDKRLKRLIETSAKSMRVQ